MKNVLMIIVIVLLVTGNAFAAQKIAFTKYPDLKLGFTTVIFTKCKMDPTLDNAKAWIDYASAQGYAWIELRDPNGALTIDQAKEIAAYAKSKNLEMAYATNRGSNDADYWQVLGNSWRRALLFENGPRTVRTTDANSEFAKDEKKVAWTEAEFKKALETQNNAAKALKEMGLQLMIENANVPLVGQFSLDELLTAADPAVGYQLDTANMFAVARTKADPKDAEAFLKKHIGRLQYTHLKSSVNNAQNPVLADNPLPFETVFQLLAENKKPYIAIELGQVESCDDQKANLEKSLEYLQSKGFITISK